MQHIADLIAKRRKLQEEKAAKTVQLTERYKEVGHAHEKTAEKKREMEIE